MGSPGLGVTGALPGTRWPMPRERSTSRLKNLRIGTRSVPVLQALGRWTDARAAYEAARTRAPEAAWALNNLCALDLAMGDAVGAKAHCAAAMAADPRLRAARENLARAEAALAAPAPSAHPARTDAPARAAVPGDGATPR